MLGIFVDTRDNELGVIGNRRSIRQNRSHLNLVIFPLICGLGVCRCRLLFFLSSLLIGRFCRGCSLFGRILLFSRRLCGRLVGILPFDDNTRLLSISRFSLLFFLRIRSGCDSAAAQDRCKN